MMDPEFLAGSEHVAHCPVINPTGKQWTYDAELYLVQNETKYATSGTVSFPLAAGASDTIDFPIVMPDISGTYKVYLDVYVSGELIAAYQATEDVVVVVTTEATLNGNVGLQGAVGGLVMLPPTEVTVRFLEPGMGAEVMQASTTTDNNGDFTIINITLGTYDVCVKGYTSLSILKANQVFTAGGTTSINFGILLEGDATGDDRVTLEDGSLLDAALDTQKGDPDFNPKCDFNRDGWVTLEDRSLMRANWEQHGDCVPCLEGATECRNSDLYGCINGRWQLVEANSPECVTLDCWIYYTKSRPGHALWRTEVNGEVVYQMVYAGGGGLKFPLTVSPGDYHVEVTECGKWRTVSYPPWLICEELHGPFIFDFTLAAGQKATCDANTGIVTITFY